jgi:hypothetical protein
MYPISHLTCANRVDHIRPRHALGHGFACGMPHDAEPA